MFMARAPFVSIHVRSAHPGGRVGRHDIVRAYADAVGAGKLRAGMRLPPVRALEHQFGISKNTAQAAYDELVLRGLLESREREGVFVAEQSAELTVVSLLQASPVELRDLRMPLPAPVRRDRLELSTVFIQPELLPKRQLEDCVRSVLTSPGLLPFYDAQGHPALRETIAARLRARGMDVETDDVILTTGSQQALDLVARSLKRRCVATENPVYSYARLLFESLDGAPFGLPLDPFAPIDLDRWEALIAERRPSLVYIISSYQNPTGYSYSTEELERLLELSLRYGFALLEDDWGSDMLSGTEYRPTLRALGGRNVLYANSFTKKLWPALRLGYLVASSETRDTLVAAKRISTLGNAALPESVVNEFIDRGYYDSHLERLHGELDQRYRACLESMWELLPKGVRFSQPGGGPTLWVDLPTAVDVGELRAELLTHNIAIESTEKQFYGQPHLHGFRTSYAFFEPARLRAALATVGRVLHDRWGSAFE
jgi:GntR family transcriptional regulator/MocR family aminotransferase